MAWSKKEKANAIIHSAAGSAAATAGAMAQGATFGADTPILAGIQVGMETALGELFDQRLDKAAALALLGTWAGSGVGVAGACAIMGWFPGIGNAANAAVTFAHTETIGYLAYKYFEEN